MTSPATATIAVSAPSHNDVAPVWHALATDEVAARLATNIDRGLDPAEAEQRRHRYGANEIATDERASVWRLIARQFTDFMIVVLLAAAAVSLFVGASTDSIVILAIVLLNAVIGFVQEYRAEQAVVALKRMAAPNARVLRAGDWATIPAAQLVPGDIVLLDTGNIVPADLRLVAAYALKVEEAALTGESLPVDKQVKPLPEPELPLGDRTNLAFKGTRITYGRGRGIVVATGMNTELGRIATLLAAEEQGQTPLQRRLTRFGRVVAVVAIGLSAAMFAFGLSRGEPIGLMALTAISMAVAAIPEALPAVVTVALALGARKMARHNALIRRLPAVETLGSVTYICSDKTGTLTQNEMRVDAYFIGENEPQVPHVESEPWRTLFQALALSNDVRTAGDDSAIGDPTEIALYEAARAGGIDKAVLLKTMPRVGEIPFDSERSRMTTFHPVGEGVIGFTKGAPDRVIPLCINRCTPEGMTPIDGEAVRRAAEDMAHRGLRVLALACRDWQSVPPNDDGAETGLTFLGLVGMIDPPRAEAAQAVAECRDAGITAVMITGDHPATARAIASRLGILEQGGRVIAGHELAQQTPEDLAAQATTLRVYARTAPQQKIAIVEALQKRGELVAMTGDGVNDAPALKRADIGIAMGITGTDVAKESAHMILLDDNFATIVGAVREGRRLYDNIRKFIRFVLSGNLGELATLFVAPLLGLPIPLLPVQILWVNLVTDGLPGLALTVESAERGIMRRPPRRPDEGILAAGLWRHILWVGSLTAAVCLSTQAWALSEGLANWQTMVFTVLTFVQMGHVLAIRSEHESLFTLGIFSNPALLGAVALTLTLQLSIIYLPVLNTIFHTTPLTATELLFCFAISTVVFFAVEAEKWLRRRASAP